MYNNSTVKLALNASSHAFGVRASTEMWMLLFFVSVYAIFGKLVSHLGEMSTEKINHLLCEWSGKLIHMNNSNSLVHIKWNCKYHHRTKDGMLLVAKR